MSIRETLNNQPPAIKAAVIGIVLLTAMAGVWNALRSGRPPSAVQAYYSTDDGQTTFTDDFFKPYPFDHDGKPAYRVYMFQTGSGKKFPAYLERYTSAGLSQLQALLSSPLNSDQLRDAIQPIRTRYTEVKKPNDPAAKWYSVASSQAEAVESPASPDGPTDRCIMVFP